MEARSLRRPERREGEGTGGDPATRHRRDRDCGKVSAQTFAKLAGTSADRVLRYLDRSCCSDMQRLLLWTGLNVRTPASRTTTITVGGSVPMTSMRGTSVSLPQAGSPLAGHLDARPSKRRLDGLARAFARCLDRIAVRDRADPVLLILPSLDPHPHIALPREGLQEIEDEYPRPFGHAHNVGGGSDIAPWGQRSRGVPGEPSFGRADHLRLLPLPLRW
jgi:hypothetical protein